MPLQAFLSLTQQVRIPLCSRRYQINRMIHEFLPSVFTHIFWHFPADPSSFCSRKYRIPQPAVPRSPVLPPRGLLSVGKESSNTPCRRYPVITGILSNARAHPVWSVRYPRLLAPDAVTACNSVKRSDTARSACCCAELSAALPQFFSFQASPIAVSATNGPLAYACGICFHDAYHVVERASRNTGTDRGIACDCIGPG